MVYRIVISCNNKIVVGVAARRLPQFFVESSVHGPGSLQFALVAQYDTIRTTYRAKKNFTCPLQKTEERFTYNFRYYLGLSPHQQHVYWSEFVLGGSPWAAERASCDRVDEVAAASRLGRLVVRFGLRSHPPDGGATDPSYAERRRRGRDRPSYDGSSLLSWGGGGGGGCGTAAAAAAGRGRGRRGGCWWGRARSRRCRWTRSSTARGAPRRRPSSSYSSDDGNHCRRGQRHLNRGAVLLPRRRIHDGVLLRLPQR